VKTRERGATWIGASAMLDAAAFELIVCVQYYLCMAASLC
jgi:hypothetical protein